jgi:hypothetical protein
MCEGYRMKDSTSISDKIFSSWGWHILEKCVPRETFLNICHKKISGRRKRIPTLELYDGIV